MQKTASSQKCIFFFLLAFSFLLRLVRLNMGFWEDEITTVVRFARSDWLSIITQMPYPNNHILYTLLLKLSVTLFGEKEWSARLPAVIIGSLTPPAVYLVFSKRFSQAASFLAGLFMALNYWAVWFSQDARGYCGLILFGFLGVWFFSRYLEKPEWRNGILYVLAAGIAVQFHLYGIFIVAAQLLWTVFVMAKKRKFEDASVLALCAAAFGLGLYAMAAGQLYKYTTSDAREIAQIKYLNFALGPVLLRLLMMLAGTKTIIFCALLLLLSLPGMLKLLKVWPAFSAIYLASAVLAIAFTAVAKVFIFPRFLFYLAPFFLISLGLSVELIGNLVSGRVAKLSLYFLTAGIVCAMLIPSLINYYRVGKENYKQAAIYISQKFPGREVITNRKAFTYYMPNATILSQKSGPTPEIVRGKLILVRRLGWENYDNQAVKDICRTEKRWDSAGFEEHSIILLDCSK
jgi:uncharacterized membrane protein